MIGKDWRDDLQCIAIGEFLAMSLYGRLSEVRLTASRDTHPADVAEVSGKIYALVTASDVTESVSS